MIMIHKKNIIYHNKTCIQVCLSVDSLVNAPVDVQIGNPAPDPECKTGTLSQKQQVFGQLVLVE